MGILKIIIYFLFFLLIVDNAGICFPGELVVIVNKSNPIEGLSFKELARIFKLDKQFWNDKDKIYVLLRESGSKEREKIVEIIYGFESEDEFKRFWLEKVYRGDIVILPKVLHSDISVKKTIEKIPYAVGIISLENVDDTVKVLRIDGKAPSDEGYKLRF